MTRCALLLSLLEDAGDRGITTSEILEAGVGSRYGARLMELRKQGHSITSERVREGSWKYTLDVEVGGRHLPGDGQPDEGGTPPESAADLSAEIRFERGDAAESYSVNAEALKLFESAA